MSEILSATAPAVVRTEQSLLQSLIYQEWKQCRGAMTTLSIIWIIGLWVLVLFHHPAWLMVLGLIYVLMLTSTQAGRDVIDGTEEFSFTLPPGRGPLFLARLAPGFIFLTINGLLGGMAIALDLPQRVWSLVFSSGLTDPFPKVEEPQWYAFALLVPLAAHAVTFATAALAGTRVGVNLAWLAGFIGAGAIVLAGSLVEGLLWRSPNGFLTGPALLAVAVLVPLGGYQAYLRKEATSGGAVARGKGGVVFIAVIILAVIVLLMMFLLFSFQKSSSSDSQIRARQIQTR